MVRIFPDVEQLAGPPFPECTEKMRDGNNRNGDFPIMDQYYVFYVAYHSIFYDTPRQLIKE